METNYNFDNFNFIESFKDKSNVKLIESFLEILSEKELEKLNNFIQDVELMNDINQLMLFNKQHFSAVYPTEYLSKFNSYIKDPNDLLPKFQNERKIAVFFNFIKKIYSKNYIPRQKIIQKGNIAKEFNISLETLNKWLEFFKKSYPEQREFTSLEYSEIVKDFTYAEEFSDKDMQEYFFVPYTKIMLSEIVGDSSKSPKTNYRNLLKYIDNAEGWNDNDEEFLLWLRKNNKIPFGLACKLIALIMKYNQDLKSSNIIETLFNDYWKIHKTMKPSYISK